MLQDNTTWSHRSLKVFLVKYREEEARILVEPLRTELREQLCKLGASKEEAYLASELQTSFGEEWRGQATMCMRF